jgi:hypothetical protein
MAPTTPYANDLGGRDPQVARRETTARIQAVTGTWTPPQFQRSYAPGKWTARQILVHLAQTELALGTRARMALSTPNYAAQSFDQDQWMGLETALSGRDALNALVGLSAMNDALFGSLSGAARATPFSHHEYGALTVDWLIHQMAGHLIHHLTQLEKIATPWI